MRHRVGVRHFARILIQAFVSLAWDLLLPETLCVAGFQLSFD
jgi:hypothetical protein